MNVCLVYYAAIALTGFDLSGARNTYILYTDIYRSRFVSHNPSLSSFVEPYIIYRGKEERGDGKFFDTFVIANHFAFYHNKNTSTKYWWNDYLNQVFGLPMVGNGILTKPGYNSSTAASLQIRESCLSKLIPVENDTMMLISFYCRNRDDILDEKGGYLGFRFLDANMNEIRYDLRELSWSSYLGVWFRYVDVGSMWEQKTFKIVLPQGCATVDVYIGSWMSEDIVLDEIAVSFGEVKIYEDFEKTRSGWRFGYFPQLKDGADYWKILPAIDSLLVVYSDETGEDFTLNIILTIPWSYQSGQTNNFGSIGGRKVNLTRKEDALLAVSWFVDQCLENWSRLHPKKLKLLGFYWLNEEGNDSEFIDLEIVAEELHHRGCMLYGSCFNNLWQRMSFGPNYFQVFDCVWLQPNAWPVAYKKDSLYFRKVSQALEIGALEGDIEYVRNYGIPLGELAEIDALADSLRAGIVIEWVAGQEEVLNHGRVLDYINFDEKYKHNLEGKKILVYDDKGFGQHCCYSSSSVFREQYDAMYTFVVENR